MTKPTAYRETASAGGVLFRRTGEIVEIVVVQRTKRVEPKWLPVLRQLPKGRVEPGESIMAAALREVGEETGFSGRIVGEAGTASWSYERLNVLWHETVHYFLMELLSNAKASHDAEFEDVLWMPVDTAAVSLSYPEERELLRLLIKRSAFASGATY